MDDIYVYVVDMPTTAAEMVMPCTGGYTIYLNAKLTQEERVKAYRHALRHVERNDWEREDVQQIESETHKEA